MSYSFRKNVKSGEPEIAISGFENGIADSPYIGIADMKNVNILSSPQQATVNFATQAVTLPPTFSGSFSAATATNRITISSANLHLYNGLGLTIDTISGSHGLTVATTYYVGNIIDNGSTTTFILYNDMTISLATTISADFTGTLHSVTFGIPSDSTNVVQNETEYFSGGPSVPIKGTYIMTLDGLVWSLTAVDQPFGMGGDIPANTLQFTGNNAHSTAGIFTQTGIAIWNGYLFTFMNTKIDYIALSNLTSTNNPSANWHYAWQTIAISNQGHRAVPATDDALYFCNSNSIGSILVNPNQSFNPVTSASYTYNTTALILPYYEIATCIAQLGYNLLIGGIYNYIYPWDRISTSFIYPIILPENYTTCIVSNNSNAYVFAGNRGYIYLTNGSNIQEFKKIPDSLSGTVDPYYTWGWAIYQKNQLFFSFIGADNSNNTISDFAGIWSIDLTSQQGLNTLRQSNSLSYGTYAGYVPVLIPMGTFYTTGDGIYAGWNNNGVTGIDFTSALPYTNFQSRIDTDIISVGTFLTPNTFSNIEFKLGKPTVAGEQIRISWRGNLTDAFTVIGTTTSTGIISDVYTNNFQNVQWLQLRIEYNSSASSPSYVPLQEIMIRN